MKIRVKYKFDKAGNDFYDSYDSFDNLKKGIATTMEYDMLDEVDENWNPSKITDFDALKETVAQIHKDIELCNKVREASSLIELREYVSQFYSDAIIKEVR